MAPEIGKTNARQGRTFGEIRWVLLISVVLAIIALFAAYELI